MIDLKALRQDPHSFQEACDKKRISFSVDDFLALDRERAEMQQALEELRSQVNSLSKEVPRLSGDEQATLKDNLKKTSAEAKELEKKFAGIDETWKARQLLIPAIPLPEVPDGKDDSENVELRKEGIVPSFSFTPKDHIDLSEKLGLFDVERGVKLAGSRNYVLTGLGARLHHAVLQMAMDFICERSYTLMDPPHIVRYEAMMGTGYFPGGEEMAYHLDERDDAYLIGTSEVPVAAFHMGETLSEDELPKKYAGYSPCYRREAGTYGKDTRGLYRVHQFYKVEQVIICRNDPEESARMHAELLANAEAFLKKLELPYRVVVVCSGDMGQGQIFKHDIETWMPSRSSYSETHSCSTLHDFQARRLNLKYKPNGGKATYCHTLNNTLVASPRILIPLIENHQLEDGTVKVPEALRPYLGGMQVLGA